MTNFLKTVTNDPQTQEMLSAACNFTMLSGLSDESAEKFSINKPLRLIRYAMMYESKGVNDFLSPERKDQEGNSSFENSFSFWIAFAKAAFHEPELFELMAQEFPEIHCETQLILAFHLSATGVLAGRTAETRLLLKDFKLEVPHDHGSWEQNVVNGVLSAISLLSRKGKGWQDIRQALSTIQSLRDLQAQQEDYFFANNVADNQEVKYASMLIGLYHLAQVATLTGTFLVEGGAFTRCRISIKRHTDLALSAFHVSQVPIYIQLARLTSLACQEICGNSIWNHISGLGEKAKQFVRGLVDQGRPNPVI